MPKQLGPCLLLLLWMPGAQAALPSSQHPPAVPVLSQLRLESQPIRVTVVLSRDRRIVYLLQDGLSAASRRVTLFDVSDPKAPRILSRLPLPADVQPMVMAVRGPRLFLLFQTQWPKPGGLLIVNVSDPRKPTISDRIPLTGNGLQVTPDGRFVQITRPAWGAGDLRFRITRKGTVVPVPRIPGTLHTAHLTHAYRGSLPSRPPSRPVLDWDPRQGLLLTGGSVLRVWKAHASGPPWTLATVVPIIWPGSAQFLSSSQTAVVTPFRGAPLIVSLTPVPYHPGHLLRVHHRLLVEAAADRRLPGTAPESLSNGLGYQHFVTALQEAGVERLRFHRGGLPAARRIEILNDYGFWLAHTRNRREAVSILREVVALAPQRAVAWLNLADAARAGMEWAVTWHTKRTLARLATHAYATYGRLVGHPAPAGISWAKLNVGNAPVTNVCRYVADFYTHRRSHQIFAGYFGLGPRVLHLDLTGNGTREYVYAYYEGSANVPFILATIRRLSSTQSPYGDAHSVVRFSQHIHPGNFDQPKILPFRGRYYIVYERPDGGPHRVVRPDHGTLCRFASTFTPVLTVNRAPALCARLLAGAHLPKVKTTLLSPSTELLGEHFSREARVILDPRAGPVTVGYFRVISTGGRGCDFRGLALLHGRQLVTNATNTALNTAQNRIRDCQGSSAFLVHTGHAILMEVDGGTEGRHGPPPRALFRLVGDHAETVCHVVERATYHPSLGP
ncbi:MAG: tetratricopeptide repeat protein [Acidiferrobacteraceae bacterium]